MQSPEILLQDLNVALRELRGAAYLLGDDRVDSELLPTMRRLLLAEVLGNTSILAIGRQGGCLVCLQGRKDRPGQGQRAGIPQGTSGNFPGN